jgi:predicted ATPase
VSFVALVDELYEAELTFGPPGREVGEVFDTGYRHGGLRKTYGRCESRLAAMLGEACARLASP